MVITPRQYATAGALRTALETRVLEPSHRDAVDLHRLRRQVPSRLLVTLPVTATAGPCLQVIARGGIN